MSTKQTEEEIEYYRSLLKRRTKRLAKLAELNAPATIIANEMILLERAVFGMCPDAMGSAIASERLRMIRIFSERCGTCGRPNPTDAECASTRSFCDYCNSDVGNEEQKKNEDEALGGL